MNARRVGGLSEVCRAVGLKPSGRTKEIPDGIATAFLGRRASPRKDDGPSQTRQS